MEVQIIPIDDEDHCIIYRPHLALAFIGNQAMAEFCLACKEGLPPKKIDDNFEISKFLLDIGYFLPESKPYTPEKIQSTAVLLLTNQCQLRCTYCYAAAGETKAKSLSVESGKIAIDSVFQQAKMHQLPFYTVDFHGGGEPSLEWKALQELTRYAQNKPLPVKISLTSNAIWNEKQLNWITKNIDRLSISMDGNPETQNYQRPFLNNKPSFNTVFNNLLKLDEVGYSYGIRMTVCPPWNNLKENVKFILEKTKCRSLQVEPAFNLQRGAHVQPDKNQYQQFTKAYLDAYEVASGYGTRLLFSGSRPEITTTVFCSAPYNALVINPDDNIVACYEITNQSHPLAAMSTFGNIQNGIVNINLEKKQVFYQLLQQRFETTCRECFCRWTCAGDCYTRAFYQERDYLSTSERCVMNREITKNILLNLIAQNNGVWHSSSHKKIPG